MARGRMLNTTIAIDRRLNSLSIESQLLFLMTVPHLDRDGLIIGDAPLLAARAIPRRTELHGRTEELIQEWITAGLAEPYDVDDGRILHFPGFRKNQSFQYSKEGASQFPPPPGYHRTKDGLEKDAAPPPATPAPEEPKPTLEELQSNSRVNADELPVKLKEEKIEEKLSIGGASAGASAPSVDPLASCIAYLQAGEGVNGHPFNPTGAIGRLYSLRFGDTFPPDYSRLGAMAKKVSGEYKTLARLIWEAPAPAGDPHDYLQGVVSGTRAARSNGNGTHRQPNGAGAKPKFNSDDYSNDEALARLRAGI